MITTALQLLESKGRDVWSVAPDMLVYDALQVMAEKDVGAVLVLEGDRLVGIFSERDYARKVILQGKSSKTVAVREMMAREVVFVHPDDSLETCMKLMTARRVRHLPVMDGERLFGVVSIGDVVKRVIANQEFTIRELEKYIRASYV